MRIDQVNKGIVKHRLPKRIGRGLGSGQGKTAGRGYKGEGSRAGSKMFYPAFEGGQGPLSRRIPKRGFNNQFAVSVVTFNVGDLDEWFQAGDEVSADSLRAAGRLKGDCEVLKILGDGELTKKLKVVAHRFSQSALAKIQAAGGESVTLPGKKPVPKNKQRSAAK